MEEPVLNLTDTANRSNAQKRAENTDRLHSLSITLHHTLKKWCTEAAEDGLYETTVGSDEIESLALLSSSDFLFLLKCLRRSLPEIRIGSLYVYQKGKGQRGGGLAACLERRIHCSWKPKSRCVVS